MLKMDNARTEWRIKLQNAFSDQSTRILDVPHMSLTSFLRARPRRENQQMDPLHPPHGHRSPRGYVHPPFVIPSLTTPTGLEAVVFVGGVALAEPATSIPIPTIVGIVSGLACGAVVYQFASRTSKYLVVPFQLPPLTPQILDSIQNIPRLHDESPLTHWCRPLLESHLVIPGQRVHRAHRCCLRRCWWNRPWVVRRPGQRLAPQLLCCFHGQLVRLQRHLWLGKQRDA